MANINNINGTDKIKDTYTTIYNNDNAINAELESHLASLVAHLASEITNDSGVTGTKVSDALDTIKNVVDNINAGDSNADIGLYTINDTTNTDDYVGDLGTTTLFGGMNLVLYADNTNTGAATLDITDGNGAKEIKYFNKNNEKQDIEPNDLYGYNYLKYDGTDWILHKRPEVVELGLRWNQTQDSYTRLNDSLGLNVNNGVDPHVSDFDDYFPYSEIRRCNLSDTKEVLAYYGDSSYAEDGTNGQVMVEIPKFYYKTRRYTDTSGDDILEWYISSVKLDGYDLHPAFLDGGEIKEHIYISAYEATVYDDSAASYVGDGITYDYANDILASVADLQPLSGNTDSLTITQARQMASNRGAGWGLLDYTSMAAVQLIYLIEYADFNSQSKISEGITNLDIGSNNHSQNTGHTTTLGDGTGEVVISSLENGATGATETYAMSYRGIENFYGNIWKFIDGILLKDDGYYLGKSIDDYNDAGTNYLQINQDLTVVYGDGYVSDIENLDSFEFAFQGNETNGSSSTYLTDYLFEHDVGEINIVRFGGRWDLGADSGAFNLLCNTVASISDRAIGSRLCAK